MLYRISHFVFLSLGVQMLAKTMWEFRSIPKPIRFPYFCTARDTLSTFSFPIPI